MVRLTFASHPTASTLPNLIICTLTLFFSSACSQAVRERVPDICRIIADMVSTMARTQTVRHPVRELQGCMLTHTPFAPSESEKLHWIAVAPLVDNVSPSTCPQAVCDLVN
jgi:hypothetical protein